MKIRVSGMLALAVLIAAPAGAQEMPRYLDVTTIKVKPGKMGSLEALMRKAAAANRSHGGDNWVAFRAFVGEGNTIAVTVPRASLAEVEQADGRFYGAMKEAFGAALPKLWEDFNGSIDSMRSEIRLRRWDLSRNAPATREDFDRTVGEMRWLRTVSIEVRRPQVMEFERMLPEILGAVHRTAPSMPILVSQSMMGSDGGIHFYVAALLKSLGDLDAVPPLREALGEDLFRKFARTDGESVVRAVTTISRVAPELSNPPEGIRKAAPDFWTPKPAPVRKAAAQR